MSVYAETYFLQFGINFVIKINKTEVKTLNLLVVFEALKHHSDEIFF